MLLYLLSLINERMFRISVIVCGFILLVISCGQEKVKRGNTIFIDLERKSSDAQPVLKIEKHIYLESNDESTYFDKNLNLKREQKVFNKQVIENFARLDNGPWLVNKPNTGREPKTDFFYFGIAKNDSLTRTPDFFLNYLIHC